MKNQLSFWMLITLMLGSLEVQADGYDFYPLIQTNCSLSEVGGEVRKSLHALIKTAYYDRSVYYLSVLEVNPLRHTQQDLDNLQIDSLKVFDEFGTGNCVGFSRYLANRFKKDVGFEFSVISSTLPAYLKQPNMPEYPHAALVLRCNDGYILVDPTLNIPEPILLSKEKPIFIDLKYRGIWKFELGSDGDKVLVSADSSNPKTDPWDQKKKADSEYYYYLKELRNPDDAILKKHFLNDRKVAIYPLNFPDESIFKLVINLKKFQVEFTKVDSDGSDHPIFALPFSNYYQDPTLLEKVLTEETAKVLRIPREALIKRVSTVIDRVK